VPPPPRIQAGKILRHGDEQTASQYPLNDARSVTISSSFLAGADEVIEYSISGRLAAVPLGAGSNWHRFDARTRGRSRAQLAAPSVRGGGE
jgi:hypothetical protein